MTKTKKTAVAVLAVAALSLTGCGKMTEPYKDAERGANNDGSADTISFPDGFSNVATKCDNGNRVYVLYHGDNSYGGLAVVPNAEDCQP